MSDSFETPWTVGHQSHLSMGFSRQEYWSGLPFPSAGDLPDRGIESGSPELASDSLPLSHQGLLCLYRVMHSGHFIEICDLFFFFSVGWHVGS